MVQSAEAAERSEQAPRTGGGAFEIVSDFEPAGDQPEAIAQLIAGLREGERDQVLLGVTGSGKTFTMTHVIKALGRPTLILAPNKTLAAQLYGEMKEFLPNNSVEYFVSYYDYYQPEAYVPRSDTYIEKDASINEHIDRMRHSATRALLEREDVVIVASVSCIYGIGAVETYSSMAVSLALQGAGRPARADPQADRPAVPPHQPDAGARQLSRARRRDRAVPGPFRGPRLAQSRSSATRSRRSSSSIRSPARRPISWCASASTPTATTSYRAPPCARRSSRSGSSSPGGWRSSTPRASCWRAQRLEQRTLFDLEMMEATGSCAGIENYSRYLTGRNPGEPPPTLFEYLPEERASDRGRIPRHRAAVGRHVPRRLQAQVHTRRVRLPPAVLRRQPAAQVRGVGCHAPGDHLRLSHAGAMGAGSHRRGLRRAGYPPDRADRPGLRGPARSSTRSTT